MLLQQDDSGKLHVTAYASEPPVPIGMIHAQLYFSQTGAPGTEMGSHRKV